MAAHYCDTVKKKQKHLKMGEYAKILKTASMKSSDRL